MQKIRTCKGEENQTIKSSEKTKVFLEQEKTIRLSKKNLSFFLPENRSVGMHKLIKKETKDGKRQKAGGRCRSDALRERRGEEDEEAEQIW